jgi:hypothetical protein
MTETASFVLIHREMLIEQQKLTQCADLPLPIERSLVHLAQGIGLNPIEVSNYSGDFLVEVGRHLCRELLLRPLRGMYRSIMPSLNSAGDHQDSEHEQSNERQLLTRHRIPPFDH